MITRILNDPKKEIEGFSHIQTCEQFSDGLFLSITPAIVFLWLSLQLNYNPGCKSKTANSANPPNLNSQHKEREKCTQRYKTRYDLPERKNVKLYCSHPAPTCLPCEKSPRVKTKKKYISACDLIPSMLVMTRTDGSCRRRRWLIEAPTPKQRSK